MKTPFTLFVLFVMLAVSSEIFAQSKEESSPADKNFPTTLQPVNPVKYYGPRKAKKKSKKTVTYDAQNEYYDRIENNWKERERREKTYERGGTTDYLMPPYFGHKKPPKIRSIEKRRYCKICGIRH